MSLNVLTSIVREMQCDWIKCRPWSGTLAIVGRTFGISERFTTWANGANQLAHGATASHA